MSSRVRGTKYAQPNTANAQTISDCSDCVIAETQPAAIAPAHRGVQNAKERSRFETHEQGEANDDGTRPMLPSRLANCM
jgi:hypothetical protein